MKRFLFHVLLFATVIVSADERPNVVIINVDNHVKAELSYFGNRFIETPHIDSLFKTGIRFQNFHTAGRCTSSRSALLTGRYHARNGALGTGGAWGQTADGIETIGDLFIRGGYQTSLFGKWHLGDSHGLRPEDRGFQEVCSFENGAYLDGVVVKKGYNDSPRTGEAFRFNHNGTYKIYQGYRTDVWFREAENYLEEQRDPRKPFFMYLATITAHGEHFGPKDLRDYYQKKLKQDEFAHLRVENREPDSRGRAPKPAYNHAADLGGLDRNIGRFLKKLEDLDLHRNTIVIYVSDGQGGGAANASPSQTKGAELSSRPLAIRWPGKAPKDVAGPVLSNIDILPTLAEICRLNISTAKQSELDGQSFAPSLDYPGGKTWEPRVFISDHQSSGHRNGFDKQMALFPLHVTTVFLPDGQRVSWRSGKPSVTTVGPKTVAMAKKAYDAWLDRVRTSFPIGAFVHTRATEKPVFMRAYPIMNGPAGEGLKPYVLLAVDEEGDFTFETNASDYYGAPYSAKTSESMSFRAYRKTKSGHLPLSFDSQLGIYRVSGSTYSSFFASATGGKSTGPVTLKLARGRYLIHVGSKQWQNDYQKNRVQEIKVRVSRKR